MDKDSEQRKVHIFDVCGTLFREDTTVGFLLHFFSHEDHRARLLLVKSIFSSTSPINFLIKVLEKVSGRHFAKHLALLLLRGQRIETVRASAKLYALHLLQHCRNDEVFALFESGVGDKFLASASVEPVIAGLAELLDVTGYVSSTLETRGDSLTGRMSEDITGKKIEKIESKFDVRFKGDAVISYSDNLSDKKLLGMGDVRYVILNRKKDRPRWGDFNANYLEMY